jgi:hypothetical protein
MSDSKASPIQFVTKADMDALGDRYYVGRWQYFDDARRLFAQIPGVQNFVPSDVLEIGPYRIPLVKGCDVLDNADHGIPVTYSHDASETPWPIMCNRYRVMVALQVWEHLNGKQIEAWWEARRVADWAVVSVPHLWPVSHGEDHANISLDTMTRWTGQVPVESIISPTPGSPLTRLVCIYNLKGE